MAGDVISLHPIAPSARAGRVCHEVDTLRRLTPFRAFPSRHTQRARRLKR